MTYKFSKRSLDRLEGVHEDLVKVMLQAIKESPYDFGITEGLRTPERQKELYDKGASLTLQSRHLRGLAVDIAVWHEGKITWEFAKYEEVANHVLKVADLMGVPITWGGHWRGLADGVHFELSKKVFP